MYLRHAFAVVFISVLAITGCSTNSASDLDATDASGVLNKLDEGVAAVGTALGGAATRRNLRAVDVVCDEHAQVLGSVATSGDADYPALVHYCLIAKNTFSPDSVPGAYSLLKSVACALKAAGGVTFDGVATAKTINLTTACFSQSAIDETGSTLDTTVIVRETNGTGPTA